MLMSDSRFLAATGEWLQQPMPIDFREMIENTKIFLWFLKYIQNDMD